MWLPLYLHRRGRAYSLPFLSVLGPARLFIFIFWILFSPPPSFIPFWPFYFSGAGGKLPLQPQLGVIFIFWVLFLPTPLYLFFLFWGAHTFARSMQLQLHRGGFDYLFWVLGCPTPFFFPFFGDQVCPPLGTAVG